jgi:hypothetical protein
VGADTVVAPTTCAAPVRGSNRPARWSAPGLLSRYPRAAATAGFDSSARAPSGAFALRFSMRPAPWGAAGCGRLRAAELQLFDPWVVVSLLLTATFCPSSSRLALAAATTDCPLRTVSFAAPGLPSNPLIPAAYADAFASIHTVSAYKTWRAGVASMNSIPGTGGRQWHAVITLTGNQHAQRWHDD